MRVGSAPELPAGTAAIGAAPEARPLRLHVALEPRGPAALESSVLRPEATFTSL